MPTKLVKNNETHNYSPFFCIKNAEEHLFLVFLGKKMHIFQLFYFTMACW